MTGTKLHTNASIKNLSWDRSCHSWNGNHSAGRMPVKERCLPDLSFDHRVHTVRTMNKELSSINHLQSRLNCLSAAHSFTGPSETRSARAKMIKRSHKTDRMQLRQSVLL